MSNAQACEAALKVLISTDLSDATMDARAFAILISDAAGQEAINDPVHNAIEVTAMRIGERLRTIEAALSEVREICRSGTGRDYGIPEK